MAEEIVKEGIIKEKRAVLNFIDKCVYEGLIEGVNGFLKCLIIRTDTPGIIRIVLDEFPEVRIFEAWIESGVHYLPIRTQSITEEYGVFTQNCEEFVLNDDLFIQFEAQRVMESTAVCEVIVRWQ